MRRIIHLRKGRVFGHPAHLMLVHFPIALYPLSLILDLIAHFQGQPGLLEFGTYAIIGGLLSGLVAMIFGVMDLLTIAPEEKSYDVAIRHGALNVAWLIVFLVVLALRQNTEVSFYVPLLLSLSANIGMIYSNFLGGELTLRYRIPRDVHQS